MRSSDFVLITPPVLENIAVSPLIAPLESNFQGLSGSLSMHKNALLFFFFTFAPGKM